MKTYLKDLSPEEVISRLKAGEVVKVKGEKYTYKMIDGILCGLYGNGGFDFNTTIFKSEQHYFE